MNSPYSPKVINPLSFVCRRRALGVVDLIFLIVFIHMKICKKCNIEMNYYKPSSGPYYICVKCNDVQFPIEDEKSR